MLQKIVWVGIFGYGEPHLKLGVTSVRDITWISDQSVHLAEWMAALDQVTVRHLAKCPHQLTTWSSAI